MSLFSFEEETKKGRIVVGNSFGVRGEGRLSYNDHLSAVEAAVVALAAAAAAIRMETMVVATNQTIN